MSTRFTRVSVRAEDRTVDLSLPSDRPLTELLPAIRDLLSLSPRLAGPWALSTPAGGALDQRRSLEESGVLDADVLYLTPPQDAPAPAQVDVVVDEVESTLDGNGSEWTGDARRLGTCALAAVVVLALTAIIPTLPLRAEGITGLLAVVALAGVVAGWALGATGGPLVAAAAVPAWALAGGLAVTAVGTTPARFAGGAAGVGIGLAALGLTGGRWSGVVAAGLTLLPFGLLGVGLLAIGLRPAPVAAVVAVLAVFAAELAPQVALARSGLVGLLAARERGDRVARDRVGVAIRRGQLALTGSLSATGAVAAVAATVLLAAGGWAPAALGSTLGVAFALRSRAFTRSGQVLPMLFPAVVAAAAATVAMPRPLGASATAATWTAYAGPVLLAVLLVLAGRPWVGELGAARWRHILDLVELVAVVALVPLAVAVTGGFAAVR